MNNSSTRFLWGGLIVIVGLILLLNQFGIGYGLTNLWPLALVFWGIYLVIRSPFNIIPGLFILTVGVFLQLDSLDILPFSVWNLWPLFIIFAGISVLIGRRDKKMSSSTEHGFINSNVVFWAEEKYVKGEFTGARINATFGGVKLDLRNADITSKVKIEINLLFGGVELFLPQDVKVINNGVGIFGGIDEGRRSVGDTDKIVEIVGSAVFGGVDIK